MSMDANKFDLVLKDSAMTIVAALREDSNSVLIAADSLITENDGIRSGSYDKLQHHASAPVAWGAAGNTTISMMQFGEWMHRFSWPPKDWPTARVKIAEHLSRLNGKQRKLCTLAGVEAKPGDLGHILVVAHFGGCIEIFEVDGFGVVSIIPQEQEFHAIGSGAPHAIIAQRAMNYSKSASPYTKLRVLMSVAAECAPSCAPPVHIGKVTATGYEHLISE
jgi:ATP-dependent protease HslVU (ClpYQ) peptidase subunit